MATYFVGGEIDSYVMGGVPLEDTQGAVTGFSRGRVGAASYNGTQDAYCVDPADGTRKGFTDIWSHWVRNAGNDANGSVGNVWNNSAGTNVLRIYFPSNFTAQLQRWDGTTWQNVGGTFGVNYNSNDTLDVYVKVAVSGQLNIFRNGIQQASFTGDTSAMTNIAMFRNQPQGDSGGWQQVIMANYNTIGHTVRTRSATGAGANAAWTGVYTGINEFPHNDATVISSAVAAQKETFVAGVLSATATGSVIKAVAVKYRIRRDNTGPQNVAALLRTGAVDYQAPFNDPQPGLGYEGRGWTFDNNPATSAAWVDITAVNNTEFGLISAA